MISNTADMPTNQKLMSSRDWLKPAWELKQTVSGKEFHILTILHAKRGVWGHSPQRGLGAEPLVRGSGGRSPPPEAERKLNFNTAITRLILH